MFKTYYIYYYDANNVLQLETKTITLDAPVSEQLTEYIASNPNKQIVGIYEENTNLLTQDDNRRKEFEKYCYYYDFLPEHYNCRVMPDYRLIGFLPKNHKYKALLYNETTNRYTKATITFVTRNMIYNEVT